MNSYKIAEARVAKGWSQQQLADAIGATQQTIQRYESGARDIKSSVIIKLSEALGVTISYLLGLETSTTNHADAEMTEVPLYGAIAAGTPIEMLTVDGSYPIPTHVRKKYPDSYLLKVEGESMNRILPNGCYALVDPTQKAECNGAPYAVCVNGYDATIKRVRQLNNGFELVPDSNDPTYLKKTYNYNEPDTEEITVIGRVVYYVLPYDWSF